MIKSSDSITISIHQNDSRIRQSRRIDWAGVIKVSAVVTADSKC